jgi:hypothetical protein
LSTYRFFATRRPATRPENLQADLNIFSPRGEHFRSVTAIGPTGYLKFAPSRKLRRFRQLIRGIGEIGG